MVHVFFCPIEVSIQIEIFLVIIIANTNSLFKSTMSSSSPWGGGWGTKLNVTSIVSQGLEQVRSLREDVEKSFDQVVTGDRGSLSHTQAQDEMDTFVETPRKNITNEEIAAEIKQDKCDKREEEEEEEEEKDQEEEEQEGHGYCS